MAQAAIESDVDLTRLDFGRRNTELKKILKLTNFIHKKFVGVDIVLNEKDSNLIDLDLSNELSGVVYTVFHTMRKMTNTNHASREICNNARTAKIGVNSYSVENIITEFITSDPDFNFDYEMATPLVDNLTTFKYSWAEVRLSCSIFKMKVGGEIKPFNVAMFGLDNTAIPRLTGITWKPERRIGMIECMGPLTLAILLASETRYKDKLAEALRNSISILPMSDQIVKCLSNFNNPSATKILLIELNSILMVRGNRSANNFYFPLLFFAKACLKDESALNNFNSSGTLGFEFYIKYSSMFTWSKKSNAVSEDIAQVVFHAIFGTSSEDLGILSQTTNVQNWKNRQELNLVFKDDDKCSSKKFTPIKCLYIPKLASSNIVHNYSTSTSQGQIDCKIIFSGFRKRVYSDAFFAYLEKGITRDVFPEDINSLCCAMRTLRTQLVSEVRLNNNTSAATTKWRKVGDGKVEVDEIEFTKSNRFFYV